MSSTHFSRTNVFENGRTHPGVRHFASQTTRNYLWCASQRRVLARARGFWALLNRWQPSQAARCGWATYPILRKPLAELSLLSLGAGICAYWHVHSRLALFAHYFLFFPSCYPLMGPISAIMPDFHPFLPHRGRKGVLSKKAGVCMGAQSTRRKRDCLSCGWVARSTLLLVIIFSLFDHSQHSLWDCPETFPRYSQDRPRLGLSVGYYVLIYIIYALHSPNMFPGPSRDCPGTVPGNEKLYK